MLSNKLIVSSAILFFIFAANQSVATNKYNVMSYNILCIECGSDDWEVTKWIKRKDFVFSIIESSNSDIIGLQEVMGTQLDEITKRFKNKYIIKYANAGALRGQNDSYHFFRNVSLINKKKFKVVSERVLMLPDAKNNNIPDDDGALFERVALQLKLKDNITGAEFFFINTHFDSDSPQARRESGAYLNNHINNLDKPVILVGDFNSKPTTIPIENLTKGNQASVNDLICDYSQNLQNDRNSSTSNYCEAPTYQIGDKMRIDYIFGTSEVTCTNTNLLGSNHLPISDQLLLPIDGTIIAFDTASKTLPSDHVAITCEIQL